MFDKTLDAAIGKREMLSDQFEELSEQLETTKAKLIEESIGQIGAAGEQERKRLAKIVDSQIALIREKVETTRESAEEMVDEFTSLPASMQHILKALAENPTGLNVREIYDLIHERVPFARAMVVRRLTDLKRRGLIERKDDKYFPVRRA